MTYRFLTYSASINAILGAVVLGLAFLCANAEAADRVSFKSSDGRLQLTAQWFAANSNEPRPTVIGLHGCGGMFDSKGNLSPIWRRYAGYFNAEKMHFLVLDSFSPRGLKSVCEIPEMRRTVHEEERRDDVYAAIHWLSEQSQVDSTRIVVVGWSHGASAVLSVVDKTDKAVMAERVKPRAAVAFYPGCSKFAKMWNYEIASPLLVMIGELDDWTPASACTSLGEYLSKPNKERFEITVYPGSYHAFDSLSSVIVRDNVGNTRNGRATIGGNPVARKMSQERMFNFLSKELDMPLLLTNEQRLGVGKVGDEP